MSACNPPCPSGSQCTSELTCLPLSRAPLDPQAERIQAIKNYGRDPESIRRRHSIRLAHRLLPRVAFGFQFSAVDPGGDLESGPAGGLHAAYRQNFTRWFGLQTRVGVGLGTFKLPTDFATSTDNTNLLYGMYFADLAPHFSFARAHVGPLVRLVHLDLAQLNGEQRRRQSQLAEDQRLLVPENATGVMAGMHGAISIGAEEGLDAFLSLLVAEDTFMFEMGLSYAFINLSEPELPDPVQ